MTGDAARVSDRTGPSRSAEELPRAAARTERHVCVGVHSCAIILPRARPRQRDGRFHCLSAPARVDEQSPSPSASSMQLVGSLSSAELRIPCRPGGLGGLPLDCWDGPWGRPRRARLAAIWQMRKRSPRGGPGCWPMGSPLATAFPYAGEHTAPSPLMVLSLDPRRMGQTRRGHWLERRNEAAPDPETSRRCDVTRPTGNCRSLCDPRPGSGVGAMTVRLGGRHGRHVVAGVGSDRVPSLAARGRLKGNPCMEP